jgi:thiosulfate reductase cytochrome b subunit
VLRAIVLPAGEHKVVFRFHPRAYYTGEKISLYSSIALILLLLVLGGIGIGKAVRKRT